MKKTLIVFIALILVYRVTQDSKSESELSASELNGSEVILYATDWCGYCRKSRHFFASNNIEYKEFDIEKSAEGKRQYDKVKKRDGVPVVVIKGHVIQGYSERQMRWALQNL